MRVEQTYKLDTQVPECFKEPMAKWIAALRSGEYVQGEGYLAMSYEDGDVTHCCLGVACELDDTPTDTLMEKGMPSDVYKHVAESTFPEDMPFPLWLQHSRIRRTTPTVSGESTSHLKTWDVLNDAYKLTFQEIADVAEGKTVTKEVEL